jgi:tripartite-type tricarboxylate transporter receptor subunit TctC
VSKVRGAVSRRINMLQAAALCGCVFSAAALAQTAFPAKPLRFIAMGVGFPENTARVLGNEISAMARQPVVVEPRPGANGILAAEYVAKAPPDGYTLLVGTNSTHAANQSLYKKLPYHYVRDFAPVSGISTGMLLLVLNPTVPAKTIAELTALARKSPGNLTYGSGSSSGLAAMEFYKLLTGINIGNVPYKTVPQATTDLIAGRIDMMIVNLGSALPQVQAGRLRRLAVTGAKRWPVLPDMPTLREAGVPDYEWTFWNAAWLPAGTPAEIVTRMNEWFVTALDRPKVREYLFNAGSTAFATTPDELMKFQIAEHDKWRKVITAAKIQAE